MTVRLRENAEKSAVAEAFSEIKAGAETEGADRERSEDEARAWYEADIREEAESTMAEAGANVKAETEAVERARGWDDAEAKEKA